MRVLFLVNTEEPHPDKKGYSAFHNKIKKWAKAKRITVDTLSFGELVFSLSRSNMEILSPFSGARLRDYDLVVFRNVRDYSSKAREVAQFLKYADIPYIDTRVNPMINSKYSSQVAYSKLGLPYIPSHYGSSDALLAAVKNGYIKLTYPVVIKDAQGSKGSNNFLIHDFIEFSDKLAKYKNIDWIIQPFIPNDGDYRVNVFGSKVTVILKRTRTSIAKTHLNNIAAGGRGELIDPSSLPERLIDDAVAAAVAEGLQVAGVDMIVDSETGKWYVMEVNGSPALAVGIFTEEHMQAYTEYLEQLLDRAKTSLK